MPRVGFGCDVAVGLGVNWTDFLLLFLNSFYWHISFLWRDDMFVMFFSSFFFFAAFVSSLEFYWCVVLAGDAEGLVPEEERAYEQAAAATWAVNFWLAAPYKHGVTHYICAMPSMLRVC